MRYLGSLEIFTKVEVWGSRPQGFGSPGLEVMEKFLNPEAITPNPVMR